MIAFICLTQLVLKSVNQRLLCYLSVRLKPLSHWPATNAFVTWWTALQNSLLYYRILILELICSFELIPTRSFYEGVMSDLNRMRRIIEVSVELVDRLRSLLRTCIHALTPRERRNNRVNDHL